MRETSRTGEPAIRPATGCGPNAGGAFSQHDYHHPAAGWGAARSVGRVLLKQRRADRRRARRLQDEPRGRRLRLPRLRLARRPARPAHGHLRERHQARHLGDDPEAGRRRDFFAAHTVSELPAWSDFALEDAGRLTEPMRYDAGERQIRARSRGTTPSRWSAGTCAASRARTRRPSTPRAGSSNEATFLYQLWARELGTNNLPDCSNMCHEASGRALHGRDRHRQGDVRPRRLGEGRLPDRHGRQRRLERAADADLAGRGVSPRRADRARQPADRGGRTPHDRPARHPARWRRSGRRRPARSTSSRGSPATWRCMRGVAKHLFEALATDPKAIDRAVHRALHRRVRRLPGAGRGDALGRDRAPVRRAGGEDPRGRRGLPQVAVGHHQLVPRRDPAGARASTRSARSSTCCCCAATSAARAPARARSAGTRTSRATAPAASTTGRPRSGSPAWTRPAASRSPRGARARHRRASIPAMMRGDVKVFVGMGGNFALAAPDTGLHVPGAAELRADRAGEHQAQPQPPRPRHGGADPALPRPDREGPRQGRPAGDHRRGLDEHGAPLLRHEGAALAAPALGAGDHRRHGRGDAARRRRRRGPTTPTTTT